jgi:antitoxin (DNA-binding transcriptional repressor) of toxin-antitoxin stability system
MTTVTMLEMRKDPVKIIEQVRAGRPLLLTYRGRPAIRLEPVTESVAAGADAFLNLADHAVKLGALTNAQIDEVLYGSGSVR